MAVDPTRAPDAQEVIPGDVVRDLVARKEQEIEALLGELDEALREADEAERLAGDHPAVASAPVVDHHDPAPASAPVDAPSEEAKATGPSGPVTARVSTSTHGGNAAVLPVTDAPLPSPPRTTVDNRPRTTVDNRPPATQTAVTPSAAVATTAPSSAGSSTATATPAPARADGWAERFRSHLMFKAGVALTLVALIILKFG